MSKKIIDKETGTLTLYNGFIISKDTTLENLLNTFTSNELKKSEYADNICSLKQAKYDEYYIRFWFYFIEEKIYKIGFEIETKPIQRVPWSNQRDLETKWIAEQMGDKSNFIWDMNIAGRHYSLKYNWGFIGVYYDFKNGTFDSSINYHSLKK